MKTFLVLLFVIPLAGCSPNVNDYQQVLDSYAKNAVSAELGRWLEGAALEDANQSQELLASLGWTQVGSSNFSQTRLMANNRVISCLDVSGVGFVDAAGLPVELDRDTPRLLMQIEFSSEPPLKLQYVEQVGSC